MNENNVIGWNGAHEVFRDLIEELRPNTIIEVGSWHGQSAINMARKVKELGLPTKIYCVDTWLGALEFMGSDLSKPVDSSRDLQKVDGYPNVFHTFMENVRNAGVEDIIIPVPQTSHIASLWFKKNGITAELIYIDASHEYQDVKDDVNEYMDICTKVMFGDDYNNKDYDVKKAVDEVLGDNIVVLDKNFWRYDKSV
jgi:hypothetical protein